MKRISLALLVLLSIQSFADEGMYMPFSLKKNYKDMVKSGLEMSYKKMYDTKKPSIKDAIVSLGGFCTAEIISSQGLMLTNHHCGYDAIRENSTPENDFLTDGFWAANHDEERPIPGLTASIVVEMRDVTKQVKAVLRDGMDEDERNLAIKKISTELAKEAIEGTDYDAYVESFFEGNEFYLVINEVFKDVRLVGAPPSAIGKYGGDTDNWMWTRHTGDFSMFRIYANQENKPAGFAMDNKPYTPKHHLPINIGGIEEGDFSFVMGYPGSTDRYLTSHGVENAIERDQPSRVKIRGKKLELMKEDMKASDAVRLQYASTYAQVSNYWKYFMGQSEQLKKNGVLDKKKTIEQQFSDWIKEKESKRGPKYGNVLKDMEDAHKVLDAVNPTSVYYFESVYSISVNKFMVNHFRLNMALNEEEIDEEKLKGLSEKLSASSTEFWEKFNAPTEQKLLTAMFQMYIADVPKDQLPAKMDSLVEKNGSIEKLVSEAFKNSAFTDKARYEEFIKNPTKSVLATDDLFQLNMMLLDNFQYVSRGPAINQARAKLTQANRLFIEALREMNPKKMYYPNANFTLRLTYGNILSYKAQGNDYDYYTTIEGLMEKEDPNNDEFIVPSKLKELYEAKDYGRYGKDGTLWVNFISNNDITGGNSGSPVMNSRGELIGCAFDGNWEAMSGDIAFEKDFQRTISADIRYILFVIDKYAGATHLIDEMTIVD
ncbi:MAG: hypothetical protein BM555_05120 [Crocinitomix sp. MedPE-SWsnd]|nr:MAG: hypothetical protein BM555_05120 [Crocinitomix sp. MedPE-SWsnd]